MPSFEEHRNRGGSRSGGRTKDRRKERGNSNGGKRHSKNRRDFEMTRVTCSDCGSKCEVPFKPTSNKPIYCRDCFGDKGKSSSKSSDNHSERDLDVINEKLNRIMKALDIR